VLDRPRPNLGDFDWGQIRARWPVVVGAIAAFCLVAPGGCGAPWSNGDATESESPPTAALSPLAPRLGSYFIHVKHLGQRRTDSAGIPMVMYKGVLEYNPAVVAGEALGYFSNWIDSDSPESWRAFVRDCGWLVEHQTADGLWLYDFAYHDQPVPWWSAMAQGQALSALVRAYERTGDPLYASAATLGLAPFRRGLSDRGVVRAEDGYAWYVQYIPPEQGKVLNGFMFALIGLYEYDVVLGDAASRRVLDLGLAALRRELPSFDTGSWSCYSLVSPPGAADPSAPDGCRVASLMYHQIHVTQLWALAGWTGHAWLGEYAARFQGYLNDPPEGVSTAVPGP